MQTIVGYSTTLTANANPSQGTLAVLNTPSGAISAPLFSVESTTGEGFTFTGYTGLPGQSGNLTGVTRGVGGTIAKNMSSGDTVVATAFAGTAIGQAFPATAFGIIYDSGASGFTSLAPFNVNGSNIVATLSGGDIVITNPTNAGTLQADSFDLAVVNGQPYSTNLKQKRNSVTINLGTVGSNSLWGGGPGWRSNALLGPPGTGNPGYYNDFFALLTQTNQYTAQGKLQLIGGNLAQRTVGAVNVSNTALSINTGDSVTITIEENDQIITATAYNNTQQAGPVVCYYACPTQQAQLLAGACYSPNVGRPCFFSSGGTQTITSWTVSTNAPKNPDVFHIGESASAYMGATSPGASYNKMLGQEMVFVTDAGSSNCTADLEKLMAEAIAFNPRVIAAKCCFANDLFYNTSSGGLMPIASIQAAVTSLYNAAVAANIPIQFIQEKYKTTNTAAIASLNAWVLATYPNNTVVDQTVNYASNVGLILDSAAGSFSAHLNDSGHLVEYLTWRNSGKFPQTIGAGPNKQLSSTGISLASGSTQVISTGVALASSAAVSLSTGNAMIAA